MNVGTIAQFLKLTPEKTAALEKAWGVARTASTGRMSRLASLQSSRESNIKLIGIMCSICFGLILATYTTATLICISV